MLADIIHPDYYTRLDPQPWDVAVQYRLDYLEGCTLKYLSRAGYKCGNLVIDLKKAYTHVEKIRQESQRTDYRSRYYRRWDRNDSVTPDLPIGYPNRDLCGKFLVAVAASPTVISNAARDILLEEVSRELEERIEHAVATNQRACEDKMGDSDGEGPSGSQG